jgi:hypothetical protein
MPNDFSGSLPGILRAFGVLAPGLGSARTSAFFILHSAFRLLRAQAKIVLAEPDSMRLVLA